VVFGWWLLIIGTGLGAAALVGFVFEYYRGFHAH
jgi:disulfide bond formation protein DsbB